jgi:hypothetical protein
LTNSKKLSMERAQGSTWMSLSAAWEHSLLWAQLNLVVWPFPISDTLIGCYM